MLRSGKELVESEIGEARAEEKPFHEFNMATTEIKKECSNSSI